MTLEVRKILEEIVECNGALAYDSEYMTCRSCGAEALGAVSVRHADDCIVQRASRVLAADGGS